MTPYECRHEIEVIEAITAERWPDRAELGLRQHVASCATCGDVAAVAAALHADRDIALAEARRLPSADVIWFKAQARAKADALRQAERPVAVMQAVGLAAGTAMISLLIGVVAFWVWQRTDWLISMPTLQPLAFDSMGFAVRGVLLAVGLWLILAPVAVYFAASESRD